MVKVTIREDLLILRGGQEKGMRELIDLISDEISREKAYEHLAFLVNEVGERLAGTDQIRCAATYIRDKMESFGLEARIDNFPIYQSYPREAELKVTFPETKTIFAKPTCHILSTSSEGLEGELIYAKTGSYDDYHGKDVRNKIVLTDMTWDPARPEKARIAFEKGAKALIIMNWGSPDNPVIQMGAVKSQWGNPTPESLQEIPQISVISITRRDGQYLKELCEKGKAGVWLRAEATRDWVTANQPVGFLNCGRSTEEFVLVGGHLEAWGKTAICNSSGNSVILELARILAMHRKDLKRNLIFGFWDGHEIAEAAGSTWFVDTNWDNLSRNCIAYVNIDNVGIRGTTEPGVTSVTEMKTFLQGLVKEKWGVEGQWHRAYKGGDESFFGVGVPYISFYTRYSPAELKELNFASLSPWLHSEADTIDKIDPCLYEKHLYFFAELLIRLCNSAVLPYDISALADEFAQAISELKQMNGGKQPIDFDELAEKAKRLQRLVSRFERTVRAEEKPSNPSINRTLIKVSRELSPVLRSQAGKYGQDPYGYSFVGKPIPALYVPIWKMASLRRESDEIKLWETKLIRERNKVSDAITACIEQVEQALIASK
jgi:hypothetical protein